MVSKGWTFADERLKTFLGLCKNFGIPVVEEKTEKGACIAFLGVTLDTVKMEARLPQDKHDRCLLLIRTYKGRSHISVSQLESLTGLLNFTCQVVAPGRPFLRRLYSLKEGIQRRLPHYRLWLSAGTKQDLGTWENFLQTYNGITMFGDSRMMTTGERGIQVSTSPGGWKLERGVQFLLGDWPKALSTKSTAPWSSLLPWLVVVKVWGSALKDTRLVMEVADDDLISLVNTQNHKNKEVMGVVREWVGFLLKHNIH